LKDSKTTLVGNSELLGSRPPSNQYTVRVGDNFHFPDIDEYTYGSYATHAEALAVSKQIVDGFLEREYRDGMSAAALYSQYKHFGDDPRIFGNCDWFSAWDYAEQRCGEMCAVSAPRLPPLVLQPPASPAVSDGSDVSTWVQLPLFRLF
jgi:hypothetical protein